MRKTLRYSLLLLLTMLFGQAQAAEVKIDFNAMNVATSSGSGENYVADGDINETWTYTQDGVTISVSPKNEDVTNPNRFWGTNNGPQLRCYSGTITVSASETISSIEFAKNQSNFNLTPSTGTLDGTVWTGSANEVVFTVNKNTQLNSITVTLGGGGTVDPPQDEAVNIAGFKTLNKGDEATLKLENAQVLFAYNKDIFVRDASGAIDFYNTSLTYETNEMLNGTIKGKFDVYNNMPELVAGDNFEVNVTATAGSAAKPVELTIAQANMNYACDLITIKGLTLRQDGNNWYGDANGASIQVYDKFRLGYTPEEGKTYDITGILVPYKENFEICPIADFTSGVTPEPPTGDILNVTFLEDLGGFTIDDGQLPEGISFVWTQDSRYGAKASAYVNNTRYATNAWLISPEVDLTAYTDVMLTFEHTGKFFGEMDREATLWAKEVGASNWKQLTINTYMTGNDWTYVTNETSLGDYNGKKMQFAFVYKSSDTIAATWEVKNVKVTGNANTAIQAVNADRQEGIRYNLSGQRVSANYKGVVIENGKKMIVK